MPVVEEREARTRTVREAVEVSVGVVVLTLVVPTAAAALEEMR